MFYGISTWEILFLLFAGHAVVDYGLSTSYVAFAKSHKRKEGEGVWPWVLLAHSLMHGGSVFLVTGNVVLGVGELLLHAATDYLKSDGKLSYGADQAIHYITKVIWVVVLLFI
jgi:hypothetical protein